MAAAYEVPEQIGSLAEKFGFDGIIAWSAEGAKWAGVNVVILRNMLK